MRGLRAKLGVTALFVALAMARPAKADSVQVVQVAGKATVRRAAASEPEQARMGMRLGPGDSIEVGPGSKVQLLEGGHIRSLAAGETVKWTAEASDGWLEKAKTMLAAVFTDPEYESRPGASRASGTLELCEPIDSALPGESLQFKWKPSKLPAAYEFLILDSLKKQQFRKVVTEPALTLQRGDWTPAAGRAYAWSVLPVSPSANEKPVPADATPSEGRFSLLPQNDTNELEDHLKILERAMAGEAAPRALVAQALECEKFACYEKARELLDRASQTGLAGSDVAARRLAALRKAGKIR